MGDAQRVGASDRRRVVIGLDVGTTAAKATAFALGSSRRISAAEEYTLDEPEPGWQVQDPQRMWHAARNVVRTVVDESPAGGAADEGVEVVGIGLSTAMHGLIGLDERQQPVTPLISWADARATDQAGRLRGTELGRRLHRASGTPIHPMSWLTKLQWFAEHDEVTLQRVRWWVGLKDYVLLQLTGELVTELSSASGTGLLDLAARDWNAEALDVARVRRNQLPPVRATTDRLPMRAEVARELGLPAGTPVVLGAGDGPLGNLGVGALRPGVVGLSVGTSGAARMVTDRPFVDDGGRLFCYALTDDAWVVGGAVSNGGVVVRWASDVFGADLGDNGDAGLLELAGSVPPGADGLVMLPFLLAERAPLWNPDVPGAFLGVRRAHGRAHFVRAAVEGVARMIAAIVAELDRVSPVREVRATGGVFRSRLWAEVIAASVGKPLVVTDSAEGTALGAAALALYALGHANTLGDAVHLLSAGTGGADCEDEVITPEPADVATYQRLSTNLPALLATYDPVRSLFG